MGGPEYNHWGKTYLVGNSDSVLPEYASVDTAMSADSREPHLALAIEDNPAHRILLKERLDSAGVELHEGIIARSIAELRTMWRSFIHTLLRTGKKGVVLSDRDLDGDDLSALAALHQELALLGAHIADESGAVSTSLGSVLKEVMVVSAGDSDAKREEIKALASVLGPQGVKLTIVNKDDSEAMRGLPGHLMKYGHGDARFRQTHSGRPDEGYRHTWPANADEARAAREAELMALLS